MRRIAFAVAGVVGLVAVLAGCTIAFEAPVADRANEDLSIVGTTYGPRPQSRAQVKLVDQAATTIEPIAGYTQTEAVAINEADVVLGSFVLPKQTGPWTYRAFTWTDAGGATAIPLPSGAVSARAVDINDAGVVLLNVRKVAASHDTVAYLYATATGTFTELATIAGGSAWGNDLNDLGVVVGGVATGDASAFRAARWTTPATVAFLPGTAGQRSEAIALNDHGTVVGYSVTTAIWWDSATSTRHDLGTAMPRAVNESDVAVGNTSDLKGDLSGVVVPPQEALRWDLVAGTTTLLAPGRTDTFVRDITDAGVAVGTTDGPGPDESTAVRFA